MELYIIRHGKTIWNAEKKLQGHADIELNEEGIAVAEKTCQGMKDIEIDMIFSSPLQRAYRTASIIRGDRAIDIITDERLKEVSFGEYEGRNFPELLANTEDPFHYFFEHPEWYQAPKGGESLENLCKRAKAFMEEQIMPLRNTSKRVMIVAHGAMNKALMSYIKQHDLSQFWSGRLQKNCGVIIVKYERGQFQVLDESRVFYREQR